MSYFKSSQSLWKSEPRKVIGVMTGTSLDAIDLCLIEVKNKNHFELLATGHEEFDSSYKSLTKYIIEKKVSIKDVSQFNFYYSNLIYKAIKRFETYEKFDLNDVDAIGVHGQTVWHNPETEDFSGHTTSSTLQLFNGSRLAAQLKIPIVYDFRSADISLGGQGAPLIPIFDYNFFKNKDRDVISLNIGGISNLTYLPKNTKLKDVLAWDSGPGNVLIDATAKKLIKKEYDLNGMFAKKGKVNKVLLNRMMKEDFISKRPPKSTGRELFSPEFLNTFLEYREEKNISKIDFLTTVTEFTASSIAYNISEFANSESNIYVSGGGRNNLYLMSRLKNHLPKANFLDTEVKGVPSDYKEAIGFAYMAWRTLAGLPSNIPSVTGASRSAILGSMAYN